MRLTLTTATAAPALDWGAELVTHLRLDSELERTRVENILVPAAEAWVEALTNRQLITATWTLKLDRFPAFDIVLPKPPLQSVTSVKYVDQDGTQQTWADTNYSVDAPAGPYALRGRIVPGYSIIYPITRAIPDAVEIEFIAGYGDAYSDVPGLIRSALLVMVGELFERREESVVGGRVSPVVLRARDMAFPFFSEEAA